MNLKNKTILLTGARRIGQTVAEELARKGANLALTYLSTDSEIQTIVNKCQPLGIKIKPFQVDLSNPSNIDRLVKEVKNEFGTIDVLIHMAAPYPKNPWESLSVKDWEFAMNTIAQSAFLLGKEVGDILLQNNGDDVSSAGQVIGKIKGKIIYFSDWSVLTSPYKDLVPYNTAKAAVEALTVSIAKELAPDITVNAISPGPILRPPNLSEEENSEALGRTPLGHWGGTEEIAKAVLYLLDADFVTGLILPVDGGRRIG